MSVSQSVSQSTWFPMLLQELDDARYRLFNRMFPCDPASRTCGALVFYGTGPARLACTSVFPCSSHDLRVELAACLDLKLRASMAHIGKE